MAWGKVGVVVLACLLGACTQPGAKSAIGLDRVVDGLTRPLFVTHAGDGSGRLFVVEQAGRIRIVERGAVLEPPFLDLSDQVRSGGERGLLGLAFHPDFATNGRFFVDYTREPDGATVIAEYHAAAASPNRADPLGRVLLTVAQPFANHNGGMLAFGPDGDLYIGLGDGGSGGDPGNRAQNPDELLGKILRIDVDGARPYAIPPGNPFANGGGRPEIYALGLRNPWRFAFDRADGRLSPATSARTGSRRSTSSSAAATTAGRSSRARSATGRQTGCDPTGLTPPVAHYRHDHGRCSVTGGYVYRGAALPELVGTYLFGDFCSGEIFGFRERVDRCCSTPTCRSPRSARTGTARSTWSTWAGRSTGSSAPAAEPRTRSGDGRGEAVGQDALGPGAQLPDLGDRGLDEAGRPGRQHAEAAEVGELLAKPGRNAAASASRSRVRRSRRASR